MTTRDDAPRHGTWTGSSTPGVHRPQPDAPSGEVWVGSSKGVYRDQTDAPCVRCVEIIRLTKTKCMCFSNKPQPDAVERAFQEELGDFRSSISDSLYFKLHAQFRAGAEWATAAERERWEKKHQTLKIRVMCIAEAMPNVKWKREILAAIREVES